MRLAEVPEVLGERCRVLGRVDDREVTAVCCDSRQVVDGCLFVAVHGSKADGHDYVVEAFRRGAAACVVQREVEVPSGKVVFLVEDTPFALSLLADRFFGSPSVDVYCIGVTGTDGKTSTTSFLSHLLAGSGRITTVGYSYGNRLVPADRTTPDAVRLHGLLADMKAEGIEHAVIEVSSHSLVQKRVAHVRFRIGVFTNLSPEHLDYHRDMGEYMRAKGMLFEMLPPDGFAVLNAEDEASGYFAEVTRASVVRYGSENGEVRGRVLEIGGDGMELEFEGMLEGKVRTAVVGRHNLYNILAAAAAALCAGVKREDVLAGIESLEPVTGRLERVPAAEGKGFSVFIDYAHTPRALETVLEEVRRFCRGRLMVVFGCGGDRDKGKRALMGEIASSLADVVWITSDNPRTEDPASIIEDILEGVSPARRGCVQVEPDRRKAIESALLDAAEGDIVLVAGKGHERFQVVGNSMIPFEDRKVVEEVLGRMD